MQYEYTAQQLDHAMGASYDITGDTDILEVSFEGIRAFLDALPEPDQQDDWQECAWGDVLHTDERVKAEYISGTVIEGIPDGISDEGIHLVDSIFMPHSTDAKWHRIPAPVQHPDPADNQFIIANGKKYVIFGDRYYNIEQVGIYGITGYFPEEFTSWEPADIVAKVIADE